MSEAIYIPDNPALLAVLDGLPERLRRYRDHAALLLHFTSMPRWVPRQDQEDDFARLHSLILRKYIPDRQLKPIRDFLVECGVLELDGYSVGHHSTGHRVVPGFDGEPRRWPLSDARLIQKRRAWRQSVISDQTPEMRQLAERRKPVTDSMLATLDRLGLSAEPSEVARALLGEGVNPTHLRYATSVIASHDHEGLYMDPFGWRVHSIVTHTAAKLRPFLRFDGEPLIELDVRNAQPLILAAGLRNPALCATYVADAQDSAGDRKRQAALAVLREVPESEVEEYSRLCEAGQLYEVLGTGSGLVSREKVKEAVYRDVFFGHVWQRGPVSDAFRGLWPGIHDALQRIKRTCGYKAPSRMLQRMESVIMIDGACGRIVRECQGVHFLTIHDAALAVVDRGDTVRRLVEAEFERLGVRATVKSNVLSQARAGPEDAEPRLGPPAGSPCAMLRT